VHKFIAAAVQMTSGSDKSANLARATALVEQAAARGAQLVALPEMFNCLAVPQRIHEAAEPIPGPTSEAMSQLAARLGITLLAGSIGERVGDDDRIFNTSLLFSPDGAQLACYRKIHLFDIDLPLQLSHQESSIMQAGDRLVVTPTPLGRFGQATCYDLRFPELFRRLITAGAEILCVPSAFSVPTGRDHWEPLLRARAIENQAHVIAPNQFGRHTSTIRTCGRSMIVDAWGIPLATATDGETVVTAEIDLDRQAQIRRQLPALQHRRDLDAMEIEQPRDDDRNRRTG
jgi:predicted amidohydrolase